MYWASWTFWLVVFLIGIEALHFYVTLRLAIRLKLLTEKHQGKPAKKAKAKTPAKQTKRQDDAPPEKEEKGETRKVFVFS